MEHYHAIVVGAGPAGAACAKALKNAGLDVLIIEKDPLPRHKICSGILFGQTQELLQNYFGLLPPDELYCTPKVIPASQIQQWDREKGFTPYVWELPKQGHSFPEHYYSIWRNTFDHWLVKQCGAALMKNCLVQDFSSDGNRVSVEVLQKKHTQVDSREKEKAYRTITCDYLVGADGGNSQIRKILDPAWTKQSDQIVVFQAYYSFSEMGALEDGHWYVFFEPQIGEMLCCVHRKDDFLTLCVGGFKGRNLIESMETFKAFLSGNFQVVLDKQERVEGCLLRLAPPNLGKDRILLTGEAAGFMYLNGEGISAAIDSGYRAGKALIRNIQQGGDVLEIYQSETADIREHMQNCLERTHFLTV